MELFHQEKFHECVCEGESSGWRENDSRNECMLRLKVVDSAGAHVARICARMVLIQVQYQQLRVDIAMDLTISLISCNINDERYVLFSKESIHGYIWWWTHIHVEQM